MKEKNKKDENKEKVDELLFKMNNKTPEFNIDEIIKKILESRK